MDSGDRVHESYLVVNFYSKKHYQNPVFILRFKCYSLV